MQTRLRLFLDWGITFGEVYQTPERGQRKVYYADRKELEKEILKRHPPVGMAAPSPPVRQAGTQHLNRNAGEDSSGLRT